MTAATTILPLPTDWRDFFALTKPRVMTLVVFTGLCGLLAAPGGIHPVLGFTAILCIALGAGGSGALNMWWESDLDAGMKRTASRPIPAGRMDRDLGARFRHRAVRRVGAGHGAGDRLAGRAAAGAVDPLLRRRSTPSGSSRARRRTS